MKEIIFDTGIVEYKINGGYVIRFNPTDSNFAERLYLAFDDLDKKQEAYRGENVSDGKEAFRVNRARDNEMRKTIDGVLGEGASQAIFANMDVYAMSDGLPAWANLMLAIIDEMDDAIKAERKKTNPRVAKYTARYKL